MDQIERDKHLPTHDDAGHDIRDAVEASLTVTKGQVAEMLGIHRATLDRKMAELRAEGFPGPIPGLNRFSRIAVERWIAGEPPARETGQQALDRLTDQLETLLGSASS